MMRASASRVLGAALLLACDAPLPAVPTNATATKSVVVCWRDADRGDEPSNAALIESMARRLRGAGYAVVANGSCDVTLEWNVATKGWRNEDDDSYRAATLTVRAVGGTFIDKIHLEFGPGQVPANDSDRLAILLVNQLNASQKLADFARTKSE